ncbi:MAG TPA: TonB-dependent receptor [Albitalea sp.]|nr:TonB-dependent receptor [Albitalea sp.]
MARHRVAAAALAACVGPVAMAADDVPLAARLEPVVVTATRTQASAFDVPAAIDRVGGAALRDDQAQVSVCEGLRTVPGLLARDRQNYAQDVQISVRGFGARTPFGIRGVRLIVDGIPATFPDGQGQITNVDLGSVDRIEVLRGPSSALYGNASGGVIQVFTEDGAATPTLEFGLAGGSDGLLRANTKLSGQREGLGYVLSASRFETDGYREHSAARRDVGNLKLKLRIDEASSVTVIGNSIVLPEAQDPMGLTRAQADADPRSVDPAALRFNTRKSVDQSQGGLVWERRLDAAHTLSAMVYSGHRNTRQFQSIPVGAQGNPLHPGGVIVLGSDYRGGDLRWTWQTRLAERPFTLVAGLAADTLDQHRQGFQNFSGSPADPVLGVLGALRRDEDDRAGNADQYLQGTWQFAPDWTLSAGLRHSSVRIASADQYIVGTNGDDSGATHYAKTLPVLGLLYALDAGVHLYASAGRGVETPTLNEIAYRPDNAPGLNFDLQPATSDSVEVGVKARLGRAGDIDAALFQTRTDHEIVTLSSSSGRSVYQNAGATRRRGLEVAWSRPLAAYTRVQAALTLLDATYRDAFLTCNASPCAAANRQLVPAGNRLPGVARSALYAALAWQPPHGWRAGVDLRYLGRVPVNDANSDAAAGHAVAGAHVGYAAGWGAWRWSGFVRGENLFDRRYIGSVIVNDGNGRYFEPAPGRTWLAGMSLARSF